MPVSDHPQRILLATGNPAKQEALRGLLEGLPLRPLTPQDLALDGVPEEEGDTHQAIARDKARRWAGAASMLSIASDGGLVIPALGHRWESRFTRRAAGPEADDAQRVRHLMELMRPFQGRDREASWVEALAVADPTDVLASWELAGGTGVIAEDAGESPKMPGFWVFSVWYFPELGKTYHQLTPQERESRGDHWARLRHLVREFFSHYLQPS